MNKVIQAASLWQAADNAVVLTGAGMNTASGLPDFRSQTGLWKKRPESLATLDALYTDPDEFYFFYQWRIAKLAEAKPNQGHVILADLERQGKLHLIATQNVDGLHQKAGSSNVIELHGSINTVSCLDCGASYDSGKILPTGVNWDKAADCGYKHGQECLCLQCGGYLRPDVILFGEQLPVDAWSEAVSGAEKADIILVLGSSLLVGPANQLPYYTLRNGGKLMIINNDPTPLDADASVAIHADIVESLAQIKEMMDEK
jgi:NAD-dependent deacetylase